MPFEVIELDEQLTGIPTKMTETGLIVGMADPDRTGWLFRDGVVEFLSLGTRELVPASVNEAAVIVGSLGPRDAARVFLFDNGLVDLQAELGTAFGRGRDISNSGVVVGTITNGGQSRTAFHYDIASRTLTMIPFADGLPSGYLASEAVAVTADGNLAVGLAHKEFSEEPRGFLYEHARGTTTDLGLDLLPRAINNHGVLAGSERDTGQAFTFNITTHTSQRRGQALVEGMNDEAELVGSMPGGNLGAAFLSRPGHPLVDLNTQIPSGSGMRLTTATDIANDGSIVAMGIAIDPATGQPLPSPVPGLNQAKPVLLRPVA